MRNTGEHFAKIFLVAVSSVKIAVGLQQAKRNEPYSLVAIARASTENHLTATVTEEPCDRLRR